VRVETTCDSEAARMPETEGFGAKLTAEPRAQEKRLHVEVETAVQPPRWRQRGTAQGLRSSRIARTLS
jgi:hypothetical protein